MQSNLLPTLFPRVCVCVFFLKDESGLKMNRVDHIPQTLASHSRLPDGVQPQGLEGVSSTAHHGADMLKPDPRDTFFNSKSTPIVALILSFCYCCSFRTHMIN